MLNPFKRVSNRKNPFINRVINRHSLQNNDITGSLIDLKEPDKYYTSPDIKKLVKINPINRNDIDTNNITGSLQNLEEPTKYISPPSKTETIGVKVINEKENTLNHHKNILEYSSREIQKQITGFNAGTNQLYISASIIDYGTEEVTSDNFEVLYNGATAPFIYKVEQVGTDVVITFLEEYIDYSSLTLPQIFVLGKFK